MKIKFFFITIFTIFLSHGQDKNPDKKAYKKRVLETIEIELMLFATCICLSYNNIRNFDWRV